MLFSTQNCHILEKIGPIEATKILIDAGFTALDCSMMSLTHFPFATENYKEIAKEMRAYADAKGVPFNQAHAPFGTYDEYMNLVAPRIERAFETAAILGIKSIVIHPTQPVDYYGNEEKIFNLNLDLYRSLAPLSRKYGVKIAIENMWSRDPMLKRICDAICADPRELARMYDELNDPEVFTICLDLGHVALCGRRPEDAIRIIGSRLGALHVHDVVENRDMHTIPGLGIINWDKVARALAEVDYCGEITLEADQFYNNFTDDVIPAAAALLAATAKSIADRVEAYKKER